MIIKTDRLILRQWREEDLEPFAQLNVDPCVMEYIPSLLTRQESDERVHSWQAKIKDRGWGLWAVSITNIADFIGFIGLEYVNFQAHFTPAVEIGWRLAFDYWGKGYATEGAKAALEYGFETLNLDEIVSFTAVQNTRSRRVMDKIGMHHSSEEDFDHPKLAEGNPLKAHVLYRMSQLEWYHYTHQMG